MEHLFISVCLNKQTAMFSHQHFMQQALVQAQIAFEKDEVPVGALIVANDIIIAKAYNQVEQLQDPTAHAEILAITAACEYLGSKYLTGCTLYVTLEPCFMCGSATNWAKLSRIVYGASDEKNGVIQFHQSILHPKVEIISGIMENECEALLKDFFRQKRV